MSIEEYMIKQIKENLAWLVKHTDVAWGIVEDEWAFHKGIRFWDSVEELDTIWDDEV